MAEIGQMTGGLAHEIKNPLSTIGMNAQLLAEGVEDLEGDEQEKARLVRRTLVLTREAERLKDILEDFLRFAGRMHLEMRLHDLNTIVDELVDFYSPQATQSGIRLRATLFEAGAARAMVDVSLFKQALLNLLINATQAMEEHDSDSPRELILRVEAAAGDHGQEWRVHVTDTGPGIPQDRIDRIFAPYFTTKAAGTGLGLATTRRIVEEHAGHLEVHSEPGRGSDFVICIPRTG
jgi:signal transduction histidine kinase